jgi:4-amino-4-deoxy-L-arabinose transferase-like glycosyltransferase
VRLVYVFAATPRRLPFTDALWYDVQGDLIADGNWFRNPFALRFQGIDMPTAAHPPLYPLVLGAASFLGLDSVRAHQVLGCLLGVGTVAGLMVLGRQLGGNRLALVVGFLAAIYPPLWLNDGGVMSEGLYALAIVAVLLASTRLVQSQGLWPAAGLGAAVGLAALTRAEAVLLLVVLVVPLVLFRISARRLTVLGVALGASLLVMAPWVGRNLLTFTEPVTLSTGDGTLAGSNCEPTYYGPRIGMWDLTCMETPPPGDESVATAHWRRQAREYAVDHLGRVPLVVAARVGRIIGVYRPHQSAFGGNDDGRPEWTINLGIVSYSIVMPLAIVGFVLARRRSSFVFPYVAMIAFVVVAGALVWGGVRFRVPIEVVGVLGAAITLDAILPRRGSCSDPLEFTDQPAVFVGSRS